MEINLDKKKLRIAFFLSLLLTLGMPSIFPMIRLFFFAPVLIIAMYRYSLISTLWLGLFCGLILDLLSSSSRLGIYSMSFYIALVLLYPQKKNFFADSLSTLSIMTFAFSSISTIAAALILYIVDIDNIFSWRFILCDVFLMPLADAFYSFCVFTLPAWLFGKRIRSGQDYFLLGD